MRISNDKCPWCAEHLDGATYPKDASIQPKAGDISICLYCGEWCVFDNDLKLREPDDNEFVEINANDDCQRLRRAWVEMDRQRQAGK